MNFNFIYNSFVNIFKQFFCFRAVRKWNRATYFINICICFATRVASLDIIEISGIPTKNNTSEPRINNEIANARAGLQAYIHLKLNNLVDDEIMQMLYEASSAGVDIRLNVRGMFAPVLLENREETKNIQAIAIIDRLNTPAARCIVFCYS